MDQTMKARLTSGDLWLRALYMIFFVLAYGVAEVVLVLVVLFQFVHILFTGSANEAALRLGGALAAYIRQVLDYQTFNSEERPFPFSDWPEEPTGGERWRTAADNSADTRVTAETDSAAAAPADAALASTGTVEAGAVDTTGTTDAARDSQAPQGRDEGAPGKDSESSADDSVRR